MGEGNPNVIPAVAAAADPTSAYEYRLPGFTVNAEEALKLLDNGWRILLFKDGLGLVSALAVRKGLSPSQALREWRNCGCPQPEPGEGHQDYRYRTSLAGPHRYECGATSVAYALHGLTEKVLFNRILGVERVPKGSPPTA
jgi:hypothetical protein